MNEKLQLLVQFQFTLPETWKLESFTVQFPKLCEFILFNCVFLT